MKALLKKDRKIGVSLEDIPTPDYGENDVLIRILKTAICGTDMHIYNWDKWAQKTIPTPLVIGHEFVGEIVETGANVIGFKPGQIVSGEGHIVCGRCRNCVAGQRHLCINTTNVGVNRAGAFAEYIALPESNVWLHKYDINLEIAAIFDPLGNSVHTALQYDLLGEDILITGAGPIGAMAAAICRHAGARHVVITDINTKRLERAQALGASLTVDVRSDSIEHAQKKLGMTEGFDVGLEMSGNVDAFRSLLANMRHGGKVSILGIPSNDAAIDWSSVITKMLTLKGIYGRHMYETWYKMSVMVESGLDLSPIITHRLHFSEFESGFDAMNRGDASKVILTWAEI